MALGEVHPSCQADKDVAMQVIADYCKYADAMLGRWFIKEDGYKSPSLRVLIKPLLNLFHGERKSKRWKAEVDKALLSKPPPKDVSEVMQQTLHVLDDSVLDSPPAAATPAFELFTAEQTGEWPPPEMPPPVEAAVPIYGVGEEQIRRLVPQGASV